MKEDLQKAIEDAIIVAEKEKNYIILSGLLTIKNVLLDQKHNNIIAPLQFNELIKFYCYHRICNDKSEIEFLTQAPAQGNV